MTARGGSRTFVFKIGMHVSKNYAYKDSYIHIHQNEPFKSGILIFFFEFQTTEQLSLGDM